MTIWAISLALNLLLCLLILYRGHYTRYKILFLWLIFELFSAPFLRWIYFSYGTDSTAYYDAFHIKNFLTILFNFGIIWEGFVWRNRCVRIPGEVYLFTLLIKFVTEKGQFLTISHTVYEIYRYIGIATMLWFIYCFKGEERNERRAFRA